MSDQSKTNGWPIGTMIRVPSRGYVGEVLRHDLNGWPVISVDGTTVAIAPALVESLTELKRNSK